MKNPMKNFSIKKRLDVVVKFFYPLAAGIEVNVMNVYSTMAKNGWDIHIHTSDDMPDAPHSLAHEEEINGLHVHRYVWKWWGCAPKINWKESSALCLHNFNVFPHIWLLLLVWVKRLCIGDTIKVFLTPHGGFTPEWPIFPPVQRFLKRTYHRTLGVFLINRVVNGLRSVSEWERSETLKLGVKPSIVRTIQNGLEKEVFQDIEKMVSPEVKKKVDELGKYIIQIGRIHPIKNQKTAVRALKFLPKEVKYGIIGPVTDFAYDTELKRLVNELHLADRVVFLGVVTGFDKYYFLRKSVAGVHMAYWESYCNAVHEYMSQGCVCIVSKDTALEELIQHGVNGYCVGVEDDKAVAERVLYVLNNSDSEEIAAMKKVNRDFTRDHSWESISKRVEEFYVERLQ